MALIQAYGSQANNFIVRGGRLYAGVDGNSRYVENPKYRFFQPRIGFAYCLAKNTVIRGGIGRFVQSSLNTADQGGFKQETQLLATNDNYRTANMSFPNLFPNGKLAPSGASQGIYTNPGTYGTFSSMDISRPHMNEASVHLQRQVGEYLIELGGTLNRTRNVGVNYNISLPSKEAWEAAYEPTFDANGTPIINTYHGDVKVANHFKGASPYLNNNSLGSNNQISAYQLIRPNPLYGDWYETIPIGKAGGVNQALLPGCDFLYAPTWLLGSCR